MSNHEQAWFIAERSRALALMYLTRRSDLVVTNADGDIGLQFLVSIAQKKGEKSLRPFGVVLHGTMGPVTGEQFNPSLRPKMPSLQRLGQFPYPVCLLGFAMDGDQANDTWVAEPDVADNAPRLLVHGEGQFHTLDRAALDGIVARTERWYDAFFASIAVKAS